MEISLDNTNEETGEADERVDADRFDLHKFSRWMDAKGRLMVLIGFYHGADPDNKLPGFYHRIGVDLLLVHEEQNQYMDIGRFIHFVINSKIMKWKDPPKEEKPKEQPDEGPPMLAF